MTGEFRYQYNIVAKNDLKFSDDSDDDNDGTPDSHDTDDDGDGVPDEDDEDRDTDGDGTPDIGM